MRLDLNDTIAAFSSATPGDGRVGARAILRLTGPDAFPAIRRLFSGSAAGPDVPSATEEKKQLGWRRITGSLRWRSATLPVCVYFMSGPRSYTRQDVVEVHLPAIPATFDGILGELCDSGVRLASPGEFTRRALLLGRIPMIQAEAIGELIRAGTADEARNWIGIASASSRSAPAGLREEIDGLLAMLELGLDFSQEDVCLLPREQLERQMASLIRRLSAATCSQGTDPSGLAWGGLPRVALIGPTGVGKSTLLNALTRRDLALVSPLGHTTRDPVEAILVLEPGLSVLVSDTAGLDCRETSPPLALSAWPLTERVARTADILLVLLDRSNPAPEAVESVLRILEAVQPATGCLIWNKSDLRGDRVFSSEEEGWATAIASRLGSGPMAIFEITAKDGTGIAGLGDYIRDQARNLQARLSAARSQGLSAQRAGYGAALAALSRAQHASMRGLGEDAMAVELREASHALSDAQGILLRHDQLTEALLDRIFSRFCIGK